MSIVIEIEESLPKRLKHERKGFRMEIEDFDLTGVKSENIILLESALNSIPPTSFEAERSFSLIGLFLTKLRTRFKDSNIDKLSFLRA